jgi:hypothetical protein
MPTLFGICLAKPAAISLTCSRRTKKSFMSGVVEALDFAEARSNDDARLLYQASQKKKGERLTPEQARCTLIVHQRIRSSPKQYTSG